MHRRNLSLCTQSQEEEEEEEEEETKGTKQTRSMSFFESIQKRSFLPTMPLKDDLPVSQQFRSSSDVTNTIRRRISSFSSGIPSATSTASWAFRRPVPEAAGGPLRRWWDWSWGWIMSRKPASMQDLEMNGEETKMLGSHNNSGSLQHVLYRVKSEIRKLVGPTSLPTTQKF